MSIGVLLVNLGTPDSSRPRDVYRYLIEFLTDSRVIDSSWLARQLLVRGVIVPFRFRQSARSYQAIWTEGGSPLKVYGYGLRDEMRRRLGDSFHVELAMRYQNPSIKEGMQRLLRAGIQHLIVLPLFPQHASATTGSIYQKIMEELSQEQVIPKLTIVDEFSTDPGFIEAFYQRSLDYPLDDYDHILLSFHGLPERQLRKGCRSGYCMSNPNCCKTMTNRNRHCYSAQCYATAHALVQKLGLPENRYTVCFQSRLGRDPWLQPYASEVISNLASKGAKRLLAFCPSFVSDCLETLYEFGVEYNHEFQKAGGERLDLVTGLNLTEPWLNAIQQIILNQLMSTKPQTLPSSLALS